MNGCRHHAGASLSHGVLKLSVTLRPHRLDASAEGVAQICIGVEFMDASFARRDHLILRNARGTMKHERDAGRVTDFFNSRDVQWLWLAAGNAMYDTNRDG